MNMLGTSIRKTQYSTYVKHLIEENYSFNNNFEILHQQNKGLKLTLLEALEINKFKNTDAILNDQLDLNLLNLF